jgi:orotidine-5'-phosphate decarboxylase
MVRSGDQAESSPGRTRSSRESPQVPAARTARLPARWRGASRADGQASGAQARLADQGEAGAGEDSDLDAGEPGVLDDRAAPGQRPEPFKATLPDWDTWAARPAEMPAGAPQSSAADLRELAELSDLLGELAGLVRDLGALIMGLITAAAGVGDRPRRSFAVPPELAELAGAHQELKAEQRALSAQFESRLDDGGDRTALRASLAVLTERATRAVAVAAAVSFPPERAPVPAAASEDQDPPAGAVQPPGGYDPASGPVQPSGNHDPAPGPVQPSGTTPAPPPPGTAPRGAPSRHQPRKESRVQMQAPVAVALDAPDIDVAAHWATLVTPYVSTVKIGLELYLRYGPTVVATVRGGSGVQVFLDLKLHDIPNTVAGAARAVAKLRPEILTVHAAGGADMIKAAVQAAPETLVAGVTLLTSIGDKDLADLGVGGSVSDAVRRMAVLAVSAGARGLVCSPQEVAAVRAEVGPDILLITPGIRPAGVTSDDQARIATPVEALKAGADLLVIGRPITRAPDPGAAASAIAMSLRRAVAAR